MYQSVFAITRNLLSVWFLYQLTGALLDYVVNVEAIHVLAPEWPRGLGALALMGAVAAAFWCRPR